MALLGGDKVGPYEVVATLGAGGMGVVYRAKDTRLSRDVALKVLADGFAADPSRLTRFEQEARSVSALNHPNIVAIHDVGTHQGAPYLVMELLEGQSLRERLAQGPISPRKATEYAVQVAHGLAAAHDKTIVHRDLKPENLFLTRDGRVKILDFGLAKPLSGTSSGTLAQSQTGSVLGTAGYMSPEQVQGKPADARSDIFSFGAVLYELVCGQRAFDGATPIERGYAILNQDPVELSQHHVNVPVSLERIVRRCLDKSPELRFQSARDLGFALEALAYSSTGLAPTLEPRRRWWPLAAAVALTLAGLVTGLTMGRLRAAQATTAAPTFTRVSFREGLIEGARFGTDSKSLYFSASFSGEPWQTLVTSVGKPDSRSVGPANSQLLDVSKEGDLLLKRKSGRSTGPYAAFVGLISTLGSNATATRDLSDGISDAAFGPDGQVALVRAATESAPFQLEYPRGVVVDSVTGVSWVAMPRVGPRQDQLAYVIETNEGQFIQVKSLAAGAGPSRAVSGPWPAGVSGLAWSPSGRELWFSAAAQSANHQSLRAVTVDGRERALLNTTGTLLLADVSSDGRVLVVQTERRRRLMTGLRGSRHELDLSWFDDSTLADLSADGTHVLLYEDGEAAASMPSTHGVRHSFLRDVKGSPAVLLADQSLGCLGPDVSWAVGRREKLRNDAGVGMALVPTGAGEPRSLPRGDIKYLGFAVCSRDGQHLVLMGTDDNGWRVWAQPLDGGLPRTIGGPVNFAIDTLSRQTTPDGKSIIVKYPDGGSALVALDGSLERPLTDFPPDPVLEFASDGGLFFQKGELFSLPVEIYRYNPTTRVRTPWLSLSPPDLTGVEPGQGLIAAAVAADGERYAYNYVWRTDIAYVIDGLVETDALH